MRLFVLMGQRKERYRGEYAPEALACMDEVGQEDNPDYLNDKKVECDFAKEFERTEIIVIDVDSKAIMQRLRPEDSVIAATVV